MCTDRQRQEQPMEVGKLIQFSLSIIIVSAYLYVTNNTPTHFPEKDASFAFAGRLSR